MSYEDQLYREVTGEHAPKSFNPFGDDGEAETLEATPEATTEGIEMSQQGQTRWNCGDASHLNKVAPATATN